MLTGKISIIKNNFLLKFFDIKTAFYTLILSNFTLFTSLLIVLFYRNVTKMEINRNFIQILMMQ